MYAVIHVRNVFGVSEKADFDACVDWLNEREAKWQLFYPDEFVTDLFNGVRDAEFAGPWLIFIGDNAVADAFKLKFCE